jgi:hypothetical protein
MSTDPNKAENTTPAAAPETAKDPELTEQEQTKVAGGQGEDFRFRSNQGEDFRA